MNLILHIFINYEICHMVERVRGCDTNGNISIGFFLKQAKTISQLCKSLYSRLANLSKGPIFMINYNLLIIISLILSNFNRYFPKVIGCLDGCHLEFEVGARTRRFYRNYKGYYSINLMAIVTYNMSFLDIFVGWPGRSHDSRLVALENLFTNFETLHCISSFFFFAVNCLSDCQHKVVTNCWCIDLHFTIDQQYKGHQEEISVRQK